MNKKIFDAHINTLMDVCEYSEGTKEAVLKYNAVPELIKNVVYDVYLSGYPHKYVLTPEQRIAYDAIYEIARTIKETGLTPRL
jgi:hypothetical protein